MTYSFCPMFYIDAEEDNVIRVQRVNFAEPMDLVRPAILILLCKELRLRSSYNLKYYKYCY